MLALAAALLVALVPQDEARLKESWPKLAEAWKAVEAYKPAPEHGGMDDEFLKVAAKLHAAFEAAGLFATEGEYLPQAVKALVKIKARAIVPASSNPFGRQIAIVRKFAAGGGGGFEFASSEGDPLGSLVGALKKLQALKQGGLDDEENVQDELSTARKALKTLGITADDTPPGLRRRALHLVKAMALGEDYPAPAAATEEQAKQYRAWFSELGNESIEVREKAMKELLRAGEAALPFAREALRNPDAEVASRAKLLLGYQHAPWTKVKPQEVEGWGFTLPALPAGVAPAPPKEDKDKPK
jgi:hypothetical protein